MKNMPMSMHGSLKPMYEKFAHAAESGGPGVAAGVIRTETGIDDDAKGGRGEEIISLIEEKYGVGRNDAVYFMQECGIVISDEYTGNESIREKELILGTMRNTDLSRPVADDLCMSVVIEAVESKDKSLLDLACVNPGGIGYEDYKTVMDGISEAFGTDTSVATGYAVRALEDPQKFISELSENATSNEHGVTEYINGVAAAGLVSPALSISTSERQDGGFEFIIDSHGRCRSEYESVQINEQEYNEENILSISRDEAVKSIHLYGIRGDNVLDSICEVNVPPTDPSFVTELAQKFSSYVSSQTMSADSIKVEKDKLSSVLPDDQRATFEERVDDLIKDHMEETQSERNDGAETLHEEYDHEEYYDESEMEEDEEQMSI